MLDVLGSAQADATVTVTFPASGGTIYATTRQDELYFKQLSVTNTSAAQYPALKVTAVLNDAGPNGEDVIAEDTRNAFVAQTPETYGHDADGNLTADSRWTYAWDAENRLVAMETVSGAVTAGVAKQKLEFAYDGQSRRVAKKVYSWTGSAWALDAHTLFLYNGWNMIAELDALASNAAIRTYVWGLDLSGTLQGAGGVGGLLFSNALLPSPSASSHAPAYDGNGNVIALVDMATGVQSGTYEYNAFGETVVLDGDAGLDNPFKFSTKYTDQESGLLYYGLRYYNPSTGRWLNRDPAEENGDPNLYAFVQNRPTGAFDSFGLTTIGEILLAYFSQSTEERIWIMPQGDEYTRHVQFWQPVRGAIDAAKKDLRKNCTSWADKHRTDPSWKPSRTDPAVTDPNGWNQWVASPPGTDPGTASRAFSLYLISGRQTDDLWTSAIGSFGINITVDDVDCCEGSAKLNVWMYNSMDRDSFGRFANQIPFRYSGQARQYMWWNWKEEIKWIPEKS